MKGKVAAMTGVKEVEIREYDVPTTEKGCVTMEVIKSNICGSDIHMWEGKHIFKNHVLGHEMVGSVSELGEGVETDYAGEQIKIGDRIVPVYYLTCQKCEACLNGHFNVCTRGSDYQGQYAEKYPHFTGGFATHYIIHPNQYFYKVPEGVSDNVAAGANCGIAQIVYAMDNSGLEINDTIVIQGAGGLGLFASAISKTMGANVIIIDSIDSRLEEAKKFGANHLINMKEFNTIEKRKEEISRVTNGKGADFVLDVAGVPAAFDEAVRLAKIGGTVIEIGNVSVDESQNVSIVPGLITRKCLTVKGILRYQPWYLYKTLQFLERYNDQFPFDSLTDRTYSLSESQLAMQKAASKEVTRAIIEPNKAE
ncbi:threonine dehydrogenase and related Zn-dependent dehydrogenases [Halalkalibacter wakoensis JCM 9140]|uniref:Threonine dehydrogenase and related Zn-dependent dehydrogenases n=1 Tax=Halalkalibacter wakoensis JCM 9140 TaxID=1236970 RepID=W4Q5N0_9BACI|nr:zinc-binding dehydrogenase [Halalkalibacter wakoensis]GAE27302.1 threonine dehydrogenase and related Zn-dependent dehydrogenases [Halalkalibacter wakoensis JCM 9140]